MREREKTDKCRNIFRKEQPCDPEERKQVLAARISVIELLITITGKEKIMEVMSLLYDSADPLEARENLRKRYRLTEDQAQAIIDARFRIEIESERKKLEAEYRKLRARMNRMESKDFSKIQPGTVTYVAARNQDVFRDYMVDLTKDMIFLRRKVLYFSLAAEQNVLVEKYKLRDERLLIDDTPGDTVEEIERKIRRFARNGGKMEDVVVMVDYLPLISSPKSKKMTRVEKLIFISEKLYGLAKELKLILLAAMPLERNPVQRECTDKWLLDEFKVYGREFDVEKVSDHVIFVAG